MFAQGSTVNSSNINQQQQQVFYSILSAQGTNNNISSNQQQQQQQPQRYNDQQQQYRQHQQQVQQISYQPLAVQGVRVGSVIEQVTAFEPAPPQLHDNTTSNYLGQGYQVNCIGSGNPFDALITLATQSYLRTYPQADPKGQLWVKARNTKHLMLKCISEKNNSTKRTKRRKLDVEGDEEKQNEGDEEKQNCNCSFVISASKFKNSQICTIIRSHLIHSCQRPIALASSQDVVSRKRNVKMSVHTNTSSSISGVDNSSILINTNQEQNAGTNQAKVSKWLMAYLLYLLNLLFFRF